MLILTFHILENLNKGFSFTFFVQFFPENISLLFSMFCRYHFRSAVHPFIRRRSSRPFPRSPNLIFKIVLRMSQDRARLVFLVARKSTSTPVSVGKCPGEKKTRQQMIKSKDFLYFLHFMHRIHS